MDYEWPELLELFAESDVEQRVFPSDHIRYVIARRFAGLSRSPTVGEEVLLRERLMAL